MNKPFFSKVHELYFKATPVHGNGSRPIYNVHCGQETNTTEKEAATLSSSQSAARDSVQVNGNRRVTMNNNKQIITTRAKTIKTRSLEGKLNGTLSSDVISKFGAYCNNYAVEGVLLDSVDFSLNRMNGGKIQLMSGLVTLEKHLGLPIQRTFAGHPAPDSWLKKMFPNGVDEEKILFRQGRRFTNDAINAMSKMRVTKAKNAKIDVCGEAKQAVDEGIIEFSQYNNKMELVIIGEWPCCNVIHEIPPIK
jgi:hypothetical protein